ncbi:YccF domain-containing protein [Butyrivibrio sp. AE3004]|uniref:YccF domain-containing protein n=1 Tax=Butyrivibrio sp. AE3004 TaxID=1506994 RepID=UPI0004946C2E|nr:YccF domain-containing protein [Butyrivibrio sp. AE3004]
MRVVANILWIICGGLLSALSWFFVGCLYCITLIGIPVGVQCFKMAGLALNPFGQEVEYNGGAFSFLVNVIWFVCGGFELALGHFIAGVILCITIVGIPFGKQFFKLASLALCPFGTTVQRVNFA